MQTLIFHGMSKAYGGVPALSDVTLRLQGGRVHALMGENGAGKSTLIKLIAGVVPADAGRVEQDGVPLALQGTAGAARAGFRILHQELNIVPQVSVAENILLGHDYPRRLGVLVDWPRVHALARAALAELGAGHIDVTALAGSLGRGDRMLIRIAAALVGGGGQASLYVLDEPTAALTAQESDLLFAVIRRLKAKGAAILYVSHRMDEVLALCDDVTVLRDGRHVSTQPVSATSKEAIIHDMTGRDVSDAYPPRLHPLGESVVAEVRNLSSRHLQGITFTLRAGEVLGVTGLGAAGQRDLLRLFLGLEHPLSGEVTLQGGPAPTSPAAAWAAGVGLIPGERRGEGLMLEMSVRANTVLPHLARYGLMARPRAETRDTQDVTAQVRLKHTGPDQAVGQLSGGNQQKVVFARALMGQPALLLLEDPTRGVDVGAKFDIYSLVRDLCAKGCAVILASSDLPEVLGLSDRILVLQDGRQTALVDRPGQTAASLLAQLYADAPATLAPSPSPAPTMA